MRAIAVIGPMTAPAIQDLLDEPSECEGVVVLAVGLDCTVVIEEVGVMITD